VNGARDRPHDALAVDRLGPNDAGADRRAPVLFGALGRARHQPELRLRLELAEALEHAPDRGLGARHQHHHAELGPEHGHAAVFNVGAALGEVGGNFGHQTGAIGAEGGDYEVAFFGHGAADSTTPAPTFGDRMARPLAKARPCRGRAPGIE
jgi:hypothetical protein